MRYSNDTRSYSQELFTKHSEWRILKYMTSSPQLYHLSDPSDQKEPCTGAFVFLTSYVKIGIELFVCVLNSKANQGFPI
jgi:hypothetical protein